MNWDSSTTVLIVVVVATVGAIAGFAWLTQQLTVLRNFIREAAGISGERTEIAGQPLRVVLDEQYVARTEHERLTARVHVVEQKLENTKEQIIAASTHSADGIHKRINVLIEKVGQLTGQVNELARRSHGN